MHTVFEVSLQRSVLNYNFKGERKLLTSRWNHNALSCTALEKSVIAPPAPRRPRGNPKRSRSEKLTIRLWEALVNTKFSLILGLDFLDKLPRYSCRKHYFTSTHQYLPNLLFFFYLPMYCVVLSSNKVFY